VEKWIFALARGSGASRDCDAPRRTDYVSEPSDALVAEQLGRPPGPQKLDGLVAGWWEPGKAVMLPDANAYRVDEVLHWDYERDWPEGERSPGVVVFYFVRRREDLSQEEFMRRYRDGHAPLAREHHPGIWRYAQSYVADRSEGAPVWHAISQLHFRSEEDFRKRFYRDEQSPGIIAEDITRFADTRTGLAVVTRERIVRAG
jgi:uncharacterized protein (TIGR02118 family)